MACDPLISDPFVFPLRRENRPGLPRIAYRIGRYPEFLEVMKRRIDAAPELAEWTHRGADDPGIALIEGAAILGDILTFYQEHYANEAYLRTAAWRGSVSELVRMIGYRLAPGIGGRATFAFTVKGDNPLTIDAGFAVKADLADVPQPAEFQTDADLTAYPHLSKFNLYRARNATNRNRLALEGTDHPFSRSPVFLVGDSALGSPYFQSISLGLESAIHLAALIGQRNLPLADMFNRYELYIYKQWLRVYMRSKMIKHNKDLFENIDDPLRLLELLHIY